MDKPILFSGSTAESHRVKEILTGKIDFVHIHSNAEDHIPIFYTRDSAYPYKGFGEIAEFINSIHKDLNKKV